MAAAFSDDLPKQLDRASHRIATVEETLARIKPHAKRFGITRIANITGLDRIGIPVAIAIRPNSRSVSVSQGKGTTLTHAKVSAMMEAIEICHAENFCGPVYYGKKRDLQKTWRIVDTDRLPKQPGATFNDETPLLWVEGKELFAEASVLVPFEMIHADYTRPIAPTHGHFPASTNGLASGNSDLEAACHALAEVIERDALSLWHFADENLKAKRRIDPLSVETGECVDLLKQIERADLTCGLWDITTDIGIPAMVCVLRDRKAKNGHIGLGSGCHPASEVALRRAITEAAQTRLNYVSGARDDLALSEYGEEGRAQKNAYVDSELSVQDARLDFTSIPTRVNATLREDLNGLLTGLNQAGINEAVCVDLSSAEYGIPVARVVVPGLEAPHDDDQYVAGPRARAFSDRAR